jgi:hypothetical protein
MKKLFLILSIVLVLFSCSNDPMEISNDINPDTGESYYPFEVTNIKHTREELTITLTWDNPTDENFSHVNIGGFFPFPNGHLAPGINTYKFMSTGAEYRTIYCIGKQGNASKGLLYLCD